MGASGSSSAVTVGEHSALPVDAVPYKGTRLQYDIIGIKAIGITRMGRNLRIDLTPYFELFNDPYQRGFRVVVLKWVPGLQQKLHVQYGMERRYYIFFQAILVKPEDSPSAPIGQVKFAQVSICIKDDLHPVGENVTYASETANLTDFNTLIESEAHSGYELVSFQGISYSKDKLSKDSKNTNLLMQLVFHKSFELQSSPCVYQSLVIPVTYTTVERMRVSRRRIYGLASDVFPQLQNMLQQGWKIVDVTYLSSKLQGAFNPSEDNITFNTMWVFSKRAAGSASEQPTWECSIVKYSHHIKVSGGGRRSTTTWLPIMEEMGGRGWELAAILDTAESRQSGFGALQTLLLVFQRPSL
ncbi:uncharacterized protein [Diadema antillarum]|uniref:uncharacterized protein n=1 Tax=Diadema antillarum TaxID=105358 RepID=UPI003A845D6E